MKIEFVSPEEAAQKILARFTEKGLNWSSSLRQISRELGIGFGVKSLMRWVTEPSRYQQKLQLLWWAVSNPDQIPDLKQTRELLAQSDPTTLERLLAESYPVQRQRIVRWKTALPSGGVWEVQAVLALARVLLKEDADAQSRSHCPGCRCVRSLGGGAESRATRLASPSSAEAREATAS